MSEPTAGPGRAVDMAREHDPGLPQVRTAPDVLPFPGSEDAEPGDSERVSEVLGLFGQFGFGPEPSPLGDKLTSEHISTLLDIDRQRVGYERASEKEGRWLQLAALALLCAFVLLLVLILLASGNDQLTEQVLLTVISLVAGATGGYGIGRNHGT